MTQHTTLEFRQLTVLFCDIVDSTSLSQSMDPENWRHFLESYQDTCTRIFDNFGGHVHEYRGDGPLVYFGYPVAYEDAAFRAVSAGWEILQYFESLARDEAQAKQSSRESVPQVRISVHTGPVITGEMQGKKTATGAMIALAERLQREAEPNQIIISRDTYSLVKSNFTVMSIGARSLKGFEQTCECYLVKGPTSQGVNATPFTGRDNEMESLISEWQQLPPGRPVSHLIQGEAGVGKSRLVEEFSDRVRKQGVRVITLKCSPFHRNSFLFPILQELETYYQYISIDEKVVVDELRHL